MLENGIIPPNSNFEDVNPKISVKKWNIAFPLETTPWPAQGLRRISINSFGLGGTNAHIILDDAYNYLGSRLIKALHNTVPAPPTSEEVRQRVQRLENISEVAKVRNGIVNDVSEVTNGQGESSRNGNVNTVAKVHDNGSRYEKLITPFLIMFSSFDEAGVQRNAECLATHLQDKIAKYSSSFTHEAASYLADLAYTLSAKRDFLPWRSHALGSSLLDLCEALRNNRVAKAVRLRSPSKISFVFTGQGAQWHAMGRELLVYPVFRRSLEDATEYMHSLGAEWTLIEELNRDKITSRINEPWLSQPACVAMQMALTELLRSWEVIPCRVLGHSSGETAAAYAAGRLSRQAVWKVAYFRGIVSTKQLSVKGAMMAVVGLPVEDLLGYIDQVNVAMPGELVIACYNSPVNHTVAGDASKVDALQESLNKISGIFNRIYFRRDYIYGFLPSFREVVACIKKKVNPKSPT